MSRRSVIHRGARGLVPHTDEECAHLVSDAGSLSIFEVDMLLRDRVAGEPGARSRHTF